ncbi:MAG: PorT family protein, partial [Ferruginibacter sp.]|nr:PorT family protein [Cytophagales bacterium]
SSDQTNFNLNYIQVPILASLTAGPVSIQAGPYVSYLVSAKIKNVRVDNNGVPVNSGSTTGTELNREDFSTIDYGLAGGLALDVKGFQLGVRYNLGLREIGQGQAASFVASGAKNSVAQLYIALGL